MNLEADVFSIIFIGTGVALYFLAMHALGGMLVAKSGEGSTGNSVGKALITVFP